MGMKDMTMEIIYEELAKKALHAFVGQRLLIAIVGRQYALRCQP